MKSIALLALASLSTAAFAGHPMSAPAGSRTYVPREAYFGETELQLDVFGAYSSTDGEHGTGYGGGLGLNYYFTRNFGLGLDATLVNGRRREVFETTLSFLARYPFEIGHIALAPYVKVGLGMEIESTAESVLDMGGGIEWRINSRVGFFTEGTYNFAHDNDYVQIRTGLRFVF